MPDGTAVEQFTLRNQNGMTVKIISYGATRDGDSGSRPRRNTINVVYGSDTLEPYLDGFPAAAVIGRVQIESLTRDSRSTTSSIASLSTTAAGTIFMAADRGFAKVVWAAEALPVTGNEAGVRLTYLSVDGEDGYPGNVTATVTYTLTGDNELRLDYTASTDRPTIINMTNHAYFDLGGNGDLSTHELWLNADPLYAGRWRVDSDGGALVGG